MSTRRPWPGNPILEMPSAGISRHSMSASSSINDIFEIRYVTTSPAILVLISRRYRPQSLSLPVTLPRQEEYAYALKGVVPYDTKFVRNLRLPSFSTWSGSPSPNPLPAFGRGPAGMSIALRPRWRLDSWLLVIPVVVDIPLCQSMSFHLPAI